MQIEDPDQSQELIQDLIYGTSIKAHHGGSVQNTNGQNVVRGDEGERLFADTDNLPSDCLLAIFCKLPAKDLLSAERVCRNWRSVINDEACWRATFEYNLGMLVGPRLAALSWRTEYILRTRLIYRWKNSSSKAKTVDLKLSHLTQVVPLPGASCLAISTWSGRAASVATQTGKKTSRFAAHPVTFGLQPEEVVAAAASAHSIVWALRSGMIRLSLLKSYNTDPVQLARIDAMPCALVFLDKAEEMAALAASDGRTYCFNTHNRTLDWISEPIIDEQAMPLLPCSISSKGSRLAVGTTDGRVYLLDTLTRIWTHFEKTESQTGAIVHLDWLQVPLGLKVVYVRSEQSSFYIQSDEGVTSARYATDDPGTGAVNTMHIRNCLTSRRPEENEQSYIVTGHNCGSVHIWTHEHIRPVRTLQRPGMHKITSIRSTDALVLVGSIDGTIKVFEPLQASLIRVLNDRSTPRHALRLIATGEMDERRWQVTDIAVSSDGLNVHGAVGDRLFSWRVEPYSEVERGKSRLGKRIRHGMRLGNRAEHFQSDFDFQDEMDAVDDDFEYRSAYEPSHEARPGSMLADMSLEERMAYAQLLSIEEEETRQRHLAAENSQIDALLDDVGELDLTHEDASFNTSSDHSSRNASPLLRPSSPPQLDDEMAWPMPQRSPLSLPASASSLPTVGTSWSEAARKPSPAYLGSPILQPSSPTSKPGDYDADLKYALELSLAEEISRKQA